VPLACRSLLLPRKILQHFLCDHRISRSPKCEPSFCFSSTQLLWRPGGSFNRGSVSCMISCSSLPLDGLLSRTSAVLAGSYPLVSPQDFSGDPDPVLSTFHFFSFFPCILFPFAAVLFSFPPPSRVHSPLDYLWPLAMSFAFATPFHRTFPLPLTFRTRWRHKVLDYGPSLSTKLSRQFPFIPSAPCASCSSPILFPLSRPCPGSRWASRGSCFCTPLKRRFFMFDPRSPPPTDGVDRRSKNASTAARHTFVFISGLTPFF